MKKSNDVVQDFMEIYVTSALLCQDVNMDFVTQVLSATVIKAGMVYSVQNQSVVKTVMLQEAIVNGQENVDVCENGATCVSLTEEDGSYRCLCADGFTGRNCEVATQVEEAVVSSTAPPNTTIADFSIDSEEEENVTAANVTQNEAI
ncbi:hypothetical protein C0J52_18365 [Blattella germanica]|nr:hypothetical protein C0J52_18365 [Blattella germanica]